MHPQTMFVSGLALMMSTFPLASCAQEPAEAAPLSGDAETTETVAAETPAPAASPAADTETGDYTFAKAPDDTVFGEADAPLTMVIYASYTCQHCGEWFNTVWPTLKSDYVETGQMNVVFREALFPAQDLAVYLSALGLCMPADEKLTYLETRMANQADMYEDLENGKAEDAINQVHEDSGLTEEQIDACFEDDSVYDQLNLNMSRLSDTRPGPDERVSVPTLAIAGEEFTGNSMNTAQLKFVIDSHLSSTDSVTEN